MPKRSKISYRLRKPKSPPRPVDYLKDFWIDREEFRKDFYDLYKPSKRVLVLMDDGTFCFARYLHGVLGKEPKWKIDGRLGDWDKNVVRWMYLPDRTKIPQLKNILNA